MGAVRIDRADLDLLEYIIWHDVHHPRGHCLYLQHGLCWLVRTFHQQGFLADLTNSLSELRGTSVYLVGATPRTCNPEELQPLDTAVLSAPVTHGPSPAKPPAHLHTMAAKACRFRWRALQYRFNLLWVLLLSGTLLLLLLLVLLPLLLTL